MQTNKILFPLSQTRKNGTVLMDIQQTKPFKIHTHTHTSCLAALRYTRRSTRTANVLMDAYPGSAGGLRLSTSWSCCGAKPPSAKFGYSRRQHQRHRQAEQTRSQRQPPTSRTESTARLWRMVHTHTHTQEMLPDDMMQQQADTHPNTDRLDSCPVGGGVLMVVGVCVCVCDLKSFFNLRPHSQHRQHRPAGLTPPTKRIKTNQSS